MLCYVTATNSVSTDDELSNKFWHCPLARADLYCFGSSCASFLGLGNCLKGVTKKNARPWPSAKTHRSYNLGSERNFFLYASLRASNCQKHQHLSQPTLGRGICFLPLETESFPLGTWIQVAITGSACRQGAAAAQLTEQRGQPANPMTWRGSCR